MNDAPNTHCGFISIIGRPNVGKSTLMNHLVGQKISITSRKPQTTRHKINGVLTQDNYQYVFVDTPGFQKLYVNKLNTLLNQSVINSLEHVDSILFVVEAGSFNDGDSMVLGLLPAEANVILVVNKVDKIKDKRALREYVNKVKSKYPFKAVCEIAAKHHAGMDEILNALTPCMPSGPFLYTEDQLTDRSDKFLVSEIIREKLFRYLGAELPYNMAVDVEEFKTEKDLIRITATIIVDRENQKGMVIGKNGDKLKQISTEARQDMETLLDGKVFLQVWVKVRSGFADSAKFLAQFE